MLVFQNKSKMTENDVGNARIARQLTNSPQDVHIRKELGKILSTEWSQQAMSSLRGELSGFFLYALDHQGEPDLVHSRYEGLLPKLAEISKASISEGEDHLKEMSGEDGIIVVTNHLGLGILTIIDNSQNQFPIPLKEFAGSPVRLAALQLISKELKAPLYEAAVELPEPLLSIQNATNTVTVSVEGQGRTQKLTSDVEGLIDKQPGAVVIMYPEGGTSGKRNMGTPYDLDEFHSGAFVVAARLKLPVLPVCQYLDPNEGLKLYILPPLYPTTSDLESIDRITQDTKSLMQQKLDSLQH